MPLRASPSTRQKWIAVQLVCVPVLLLFLFTGVPTQAAPPEVMYAMSGIVIIGLLVLGNILANRMYKHEHALMQEQERFIADVTHDLRTPITALRTLFEVSQRDPTLRQATTQDLLERGLRQITGIQSMTDRLLELSAYRAGKTPQPATVDVDMAIEEAIETVRPLAEGKATRFEYRQSSQNIQAVAKEAHRLLVILLDNAIKYGPKNAAIRIVVERHRSVVSISVTDEGPGISYADHKRIFNRFYRADSSRQRQSPHEGFGLGLAIAREITRRNGGDISIKSRLGAGSTFVVTFRAA